MKMGAGWRAPPAGRGCIRPFFLLVLPHSPVRKAIRKMKVYCAHSTAFDFRNEYYRPLARLAQAGGHEFVFPHEGRNAAQDSREVIRSCDLVLAEVSHPSTGMGIELGWASAFGKPVVALYKRDAVPSSSLSVITGEIHPYSSPDELVSIVCRFMK